MTYNFTPEETAKAIFGKVIYTDMGFFYDPEEHEKEIEYISSSINELRNTNDILAAAIDSMLYSDEEETATIIEYVTSLQGKTSYYDLMMKGKRITISGKGNTPATFYIKDGKIRVYSKELGDFEHPKTSEEIKEHFEKMENEGFNLISE